MESSGVAPVEWALTKHQQVWFTLDLASPKSTLDVLTKEALLMRQVPVVHGDPLDGAVAFYDELGEWRRHPIRFMVDPIETARDAARLPSLGLDVLRGYHLVVDPDEGVCLLYGAR